MDQHDITQYLKGWHKGKHNSLDEIFPVVYDQLRVIAKHYFKNESPDHTLQPTILVNEAYCRLHKQKPNFELQNRSHFFALAGRVMRQILVDHARSKKRLKRGGDAIRVTLTSIEDSPAQSPVDMVILNDALNELETQDERMVRIIEMLYFAGLTIDETADLMDLSSRTIKREWRLARAWLYKKLKR